MDDDDDSEEQEYQDEEEKEEEGDYEEEHEQEVQRRSALRSWDEDEPADESPSKRNYLQEMKFESIREDTMGENEQSDDHNAKRLNPLGASKKKRVVVKESTLKRYSAKKQEQNA